jgi:hypothetical protein
MRSNDPYIKIPFTFPLDYFKRGLQFNGIVSNISNVAIKHFTSTIIDLLDDSSDASSNANSDANGHANSHANSNTTGNTTGNTTSNTTGKNSACVCTEDRLLCTGDKLVCTEDKLIYDLKRALFIGDLSHLSHLNDLSHLHKDLDNDLDNDPDKDLANFKDDELQSLDFYKITSAIYSDTVLSFIDKPLIDKSLKESALFTDNPSSNRILNKTSYDLRTFDNLETPFDFSHLYDHLYSSFTFKPNSLDTYLYQVHSSHSDDIKDLFDLVINSILEEVFNFSKTSSSTSKAHVTAPTYSLEEVSKRLKQVVNHCMKNYNESLYFDDPSHKETFHVFLTKSFKAQTYIKDPNLVYYYIEAAKLTEKIIINKIIENADSSEFNKNYSKFECFSFYTDVYLANVVTSSIYEKSSLVESLCFSQLNCYEFFQSKADSKTPSFPTLSYSICNNFNTGYITQLFVSSLFKTFLFSDFTEFKKIFQNYKHALLKRALPKCDNYLLLKLHTSQSLTEL